MSARQLVVDLLSVHGGGLEFDALQVETGIPPEVLESLLSNMRRNQVIRSVNGTWILHGATVRSIRREIERPNTKTTKVKPSDVNDIAVQRLKHDTKQHQQMLGAIRRRIDKISDELIQLKRELKKYEQSAGISA